MLHRPKAKDNSDAVTTAEIHFTQNAETASEWLFRCYGLFGIPIAPDKTLGNVGMLAFGVTGSYFHCAYESSAAQMNHLKNNLVACKLRAISS